MPAAASCRPWQCSCAVLGQGYGYTSYGYGMDAHASKFWKHFCSHRPVCREPKCQPNQVHLHQYKGPIRHIPVITNPHHHDHHHGHGGSYGPGPKPYGSNGGNTYPAPPTPYGSNGGNVYPAPPTPNPYGAPPPGYPPIPN